jgi:hypothetical protein
VSSSSSTGCNQRFRPGKAYLRGYDGDFLLPDLEEQAFLAARKPPMFDRAPVEDATAADLDEALLDSFTASIRRNDPDGRGRFTDQGELPWRLISFTCSSNIVAQGSDGCLAEVMFPPWRVSRCARSADGSVHVVAAPQPDGALLAVADGCGGIPEADLAHVFDTAWRGACTRPDTDGGAGLGLAIVRGIVEAHRGQVRVVNTREGCRFEVRLPALAAPASQ